MFGFLLALCCQVDNDSTYELEPDYARSKLLSQTCDMYAEASLHIKTTFRDTELLKLKPPHGHTHGVSATKRSEASILMDMVAKSVGRRLVQYQGSSADIRNKRAITRTWHWAKDIQIPPTSCDKTDNDFVAMVDVDYYVDMPKFLAQHVQPTMLYTFQPSRVSCDKGEYKYTFDHDNNVMYRVSGGGSYEHQVWNYDGDSLSTSTWFCCFPSKLVTYNIERKRIDADHQVILLTPLAKFSWLSAWYARHHITELPLTRLSVASGEFLRLVTNESDGLIVHTGMCSKYINASVPVAVDNAIECAVRTSTTKLTLAAIKSKLAHAQIENHGAEVLQLYHTTKQPYHKPEIVSNLSEGVRSFQWTDRVDDLDHEIKPSMVAFMQPLYHGAFVPQDCYNNDVRTVRERITKVQSAVEITDFMKRCVDEWVQLLIDNGVNHLIPVDLEMVYEKQNRPSQRAILHRADNEDPIDKVDSFMKKEAYPTINDPRNISTINGARKRDYSCYMYALAEAFKHLPWYAFGKTPRDLAIRVAEICAAASSHVDITDFNRMDGRVSPAARYLQRCVLANVFHTPYRLEIMTLARSQTGLAGRTRHGVKYDSKTGRVSGSPETSIENTNLSAFTAYSSLRSTKIQGKYLTPQQAWDRLGTYGGDDGLTCDLDKRMSTKRAAEIGQILTSDRVMRGEIGVSFLARRYGPDVWYSNAMDGIDSVCDIKRVLHKFHVTICLPLNIPASQKLYDKAYALHLTDRNTPVIGAFTTKVLSLFPKHKFSNSTRIWNVETIIGNQYPNNSVDWAWNIVNDELSGFDHDVFENWLHNATIETIFLPPKLMDIAPSAMKFGTVMVDGDVLVKDPKPIPEITRKRPERARPIPNNKKHTRRKTRSTVTSLGKATPRNEREPRN